MKTVFVIGAGPAGLFAAQKFALAGHQVLLLNRDIKPGGLAEYGIYPEKHKMKGSLRKTFAKMLALPNLHYVGHTPVGTQHPVTIETLREFNPNAIVFAVGAQGTKKLGLPGEDAKRVYSAKDYVFYYNQLPPFASRDFSTGKRVAVVGMGNVMVDIVRWLLIDDPYKNTEEVTVVARRGPFEAKFDKKEFEHIEDHLDRADFAAELKRVAPKIAGVGQDVEKLPEEEQWVALKKPAAETKRPILRFRFLCSPKEIHTGADGVIDGLTVTENNLVLRDGKTAAKATDQTEHLDVDTMIFAIGDSADPTLGLPYANNEYVTRPESQYQVFDPATAAPILGMYVVGWARRASEGLVGIAKMDGESGANYVLKYLEGAPDLKSATDKEVRDALEGKGVQFVTKDDLAHLTKIEEQEAAARNLPYFKYADDALMLTAIEKAKTSAIAATSAND